MEFKEKFSGGHEIDRGTSKNLILDNTEGEPPPETVKQL